MLCMTSVSSNLVCVELETRDYHVFVKCEAVLEVHNVCKEVLRTLLGKNISSEEIIHLAFNHRCKKRLAIAIWFAVKVMYSIYHKNNRNKMQLLRELIK